MNIKISKKYYACTHDLINYRDLYLGLENINIFFN